MTNTQKNRRTKKGVTLRIYDSQMSNSKARGHAQPTYSKSWLRKWLLSNPEFHRLYDMWVLSGYDKWFKPSVDRKDDNLSYTEYNIQLMTWKENKDKQSRDLRSGKLTHGNNPQKPVEQYTIGGELVAEFISTREAERSAGISKDGVGGVCRGKHKTAGGYVWKYKEGVQND